MKRGKALYLQSYSRGSHPLLHTLFANSVEKGAEALRLPRMTRKRQNYTGSKDLIDFVDPLRRMGSLWGMMRAIRIGMLSVACLAGAMWGALPAAQALEVRIEAERFILDREKNTISYQNGRLQAGGLTFFASRMELDIKARIARSSGLIRFQSDKMFGSAAEMEFDMVRQVARLKQVRLFDAEHGLFIQAREIAILPGGQLRIRQCTFTTCRPGVSVPWRFSASELTLRPNALAMAWNPTLYLGPVPVFWLPVIIWPTVRERRTGVLPPTLERDGSSLQRLDLGFRLKVPVFIDLDVDHDLTLAPEAIENRGHALGLEYNYAFLPGMRGKFTVFGLKEKDPRNPALENDILDPGEAILRDPRPLRFLLDWEHNQALGEASRLVLSYRHSSDGQVGREYKGITQFRPFQSYQATLSNQTSWIDSFLTFEQNADYQDESFYSDHAGATDQGLRPRLFPRFSGVLGGVVSDWFPLALELGLEGVQFEASEDVSGNLGVISPGLSLPIALGGAYTFRLTARRHFVDYSGLTQFDSGSGTQAIEDQSFQQTEAEAELSTTYARTYPQSEGRFDALKHRIVPRLIFRQVEDVAQPEPLTDLLLRARVAQRLAVLRLDNTLLGRLAGGGAGVSGTEKAASANAGDVRELLSINLIQRYNFLREADADPLQGPGFSGDQETDAGEPLLPLILSGQAKGAGYTLRFRLDYHHQQDRLTRAALSWAGQAGPHTSLSAGYGFNAFTHFTPDNKLVPESNSFNFAGEMALGGALSMGFSGRFNLLDRAPPLDKRLDRSLLFLEYNPACYAVRLSVEETVNTVLENGQESFFVNRRVALTFNLRGLVGGGKTATRNENNTPPARQTAALGPPARCGI